MKRGRRPKSAAVRRSEGCRGHRPIIDEVEPAAGEIQPPKFVQADAETLEEWHEIMALLRPMQHVTPADANIVGRLAALRCRWYHALNQCRSGLDVIELKRPDGGTKALSSSPYASDLIRIAQQIERLEMALGLSPASRAQLAAMGVTKETADDNPLRRFGIAS